MSAHFLRRHRNLQPWLVLFGLVSVICGLVITLAIVAMRGLS